MAAVGGQILALIVQNHALESIKPTLAFLYTIFSIVMLIIFYLFNEFSYSQMISGFYMMLDLYWAFFSTNIYKIF